MDRAVDVQVRRAEARAGAGAVANRAGPLTGPTHTGQRPLHIAPGGLFSPLAPSAGMQAVAMWNGLVALAAAGIALAGCVQPLAPQSASAGAGFDEYRDCLGAMATAYAADCEDPQGSTRYSAPVGQSDEVPEGWTCRAAIDFRATEPNSPAWWLWTRPAPIDQPQDIVARRLLVGLEYEVAPRSGPFEGVFQLFSQPDAPIVRWTSEATHAFVEVGVARADEEVEFDGAIVGVTNRQVDINWSDYGSHPDLSDPGTLPGPSGFNATGVNVTAVEQAWGRHSRNDGWYPALFPTNVVRFDDEVRYLPAIEGPASGGPDPKTQAGSGHWGGASDQTAWTNETDGGATIQVRQNVHLRFYGHFERLDQLALTGGCDFCPILDPSDPHEGIRCRLP